MCPDAPPPIPILRLWVDFCHGGCIVVVYPCVEGVVGVGVVLSEGVSAVLGLRAADLGLPVDEYAEVLLRSQLFLLEELGA